MFLFLALRTDRHLQPVVDGKGCAKKTEKEIKRRRQEYQRQHHQHFMLAPTAAKICPIMCRGCRRHMSPSKPNAPELSKRYVRGAEYELHAPCYEITVAVLHEQKCCEVFLSGAFTTANVFSEDRPVDITHAIFSYILILDFYLQWRVRMSRWLHPVIHWSRLTACDPQSRICSCPPQVVSMSSLYIRAVTNGQGQAV